MKYKTALFWLLLFCALTAFLQYAGRYHFFFIEQKQLFLFTSMYACDMVRIPGGVALYIASFLQQFFIYPVAGAIITAGLLIGVGLLTRVLIKQIAPACRSFILYLLPVLALFFLHFNFNYLIQGTVAYLLMQTALIAYCYIPSFYKRLIAGALLIPLLFFVAGPVSILLAVSLVLWELCRKQPRGYLVLLLLLEAVLVSLLSVYLGESGAFRFAFLPDAYYQVKLRPEAVIYFCWWILPIVMFIAFFIHNKKETSFRTQVNWVVFQLIILFGTAYWGVGKYGDASSYKMKTLDYYARTEQWDKIINACEGKLTNFLYLNYLNMALAQKGILADTMFSFNQRGIVSLGVEWNKTTHISTLLSDINFTFGNIASARQLAFEGYACETGVGNPRLLKRLVQTNLIYGDYPVAEKYISLLENTIYYSAWATAQRLFLNNDEAVAANPLLGNKRKGLSPENRLVSIDGMIKEQCLIAEANPSDPTAIQYAGCSYLLAKDMESFKLFIEQYYGTEVLPMLPISFQEAVITYSEQTPEYWPKHGVTPETVARFVAYKKYLLANKGRNDLPQLMLQTAGTTYWYYLMFT